MSSQNNNNNNNNDDDDESDGCCGLCVCCNRYALLLNSYIEKAFCAIGYIVGQWPYVVLGLVLLFLSLCCFGFIFTTIESDIFNLWTPTNSPVFEEKEFINFYWKNKDYGLLVLSGYAKSGEDTNILNEEYLNEWYEIHMDLMTNLPTKQYEYTGSDNSPSYITFSYFAENYYSPPSVTRLAGYASAGIGPTHYASEIVPFCRPFAQSPAEGQFEMPCYMIHVFDCFSEGGYFLPFENYLKQTLFASNYPNGANIYTYKDSFAGKSSFELGEILGPSCITPVGVRTPPNYIYGGETRINGTDSSSTIIDLKSYQTIGYVDSPYGIARKIKIAKGDCKYDVTLGINCPDINDDELEAAQTFLDEWLLDYIDYMKQYTESLKNDDSKLFNLVFWTPRTTRDLLAEASSADFGLLAIAYIGMIIFASLTAINISDWFLSRSEASCGGVLLVLFAVIATIGLGSFLQIPLSPNIVQVLPFIALGFGVDDMFVLLFSFKYRERLSVEEMIAETTRIAGSSVALTSLANFCGFLIGTTMVLPDVARFATFGAIIVLLNFIAIIFGFTAILTLVARRMKNEYNDWSFIFCWATFTRASKITSEKASSQSVSIFDPLFDWLTKTYTRIVMIIIFLTLIIIGIYGCTLISPGLPLADIVPYNSYASDFLRIRELFYFTYIISLYSDARGAEHKPIDWENKLEEFINKTEDIYSISDTIYSDPSIHDFWAWNLRDYLQKQYMSHLTGKYELGDTFDIEAALGDGTVYQPFMCNDDITKYCDSMQRVFVYQSDLFNCLLVNYNFGTLTNDCSQWVYSVVVENIDIGAIAKQIYITSYEDIGNDAIDINGLYVRPSTNDIKVFIKYPQNDGYIYQTDCGMDECEWYLLDENFNILYRGEATSVDDTEAPSQNGWRDAATGDKPVKITHLYYDFIVSYLNASRDTDDMFISTDVIPQSLFSFSYLYEPSTEADTSPACIQWEVMKLLMTDSDAFDSISMSNIFTESDMGTTGQYDVTCNAVLEASEMCVAIKDEKTLGTVNCGFTEQTANHDFWYLGNTSSDGLYQIMSVPYSGQRTDLIASPNTFNNCDDPTQWKNNTNFTYNYMKPCGSIDNFGGFGISQSSNKTMCSMDDQRMNLQCESLTDCTNLRVCFNDINDIFLHSDSQNCDRGDIAEYERRIKSGHTMLSAIAVIDACLLKNYNKLTSCCQSAVDSVILTLPEKQCSEIDGEFTPKSVAEKDDLKAVCEKKNNCQYNSATNECAEVYTGSVFNDCNQLIINDGTCSLKQLNNITKSMIRSGDQQDFYDCMNTEVRRCTGSIIFGNCVGYLASYSSFCESTFDNQVANGLSNCLYPVESFWDFTEEEYDYSMCSSSDIDAVGCTSPSNQTKLECLEANVGSLTGCCQLAINQISTDTYSFTKECEGDVSYYCAAFGITSAGTALAAAVGGVCVDNPSDPGTQICPGIKCIELLVAASSANGAGLSDKCHEAMYNCEPIGNWPKTPAGSTPATIACPIGYSGEQTRTCSSTNGIPVQWGAIDNTSCIQLTCPEILATNDTYDQYWPQTPWGSIYKIQGGTINQFGDIDTMTQISKELQDLYKSETNDTCDPQNGYNIWYLRRACILDPYTLSAIWQEPIIECKPFPSFWHNIQENTVCDFITPQIVSGLASTIDSTFAAVPPFVGSLKSTPKANLIDAVVWSIYDDLYNDGITTSNDDHIKLSKLQCSSQLTNCAAFSYDNIFNISYFFDYCPTLDSNDLSNGIIEEIVDSPAYETTNGALDNLAIGISQQKGILNTPYQLTKDYFTLYASLTSDATDIIAGAIWTGLSSDVQTFVVTKFGLPSFKLINFADRHTTYISPLNSVEFTASYCSLRTIEEIVVSQTREIADFITPTAAWNNKGIPKSECFNNTLWLFFIDPSGGVRYRDKIYFVDPTQVANTTGFDNVEIVSTSNSITVRDIDDDEIAVELIIDLRLRLDSWANDNEIYIIPGGLVINLFSQYIDVDIYLINNIIYVSVAIILCGLIFLLNPIAVIVAIICNIAMVIEVYGFSDWFGLRINGVLVLNITIAVALTMEFTAHIGRAFVLSFVTEHDRKSSIALPFSDDGQIRMKKTLREMFNPVSLGALTTLIGVAPIAAAQFPYFRQYYFTLYVIIVLFGWLNGVIFQVIILSFIPPKPFHHLYETSNIEQEQAPKQQKQKQIEMEKIQSDDDEEEEYNNNNNLKKHQELQQEQEQEKKKTDDGYNETKPMINKEEEETITNTGYDGNDDLNVKTEVIKRRHTRTDQDAP